MSSSKTSPYWTDFSRRRFNSPHMYHILANSFRNFIQLGAKKIANFIGEQILKVRLGGIRGGHALHQIEAYAELRTELESICRLTENSCLCPLINHFKLRKLLERKNYFQSEIY